MCFSIELVRNERTIKKNTQYNRLNKIKSEDIRDNEKRRNFFFMATHLPEILFFSETNDSDIDTKFRYIWLFMWDSKRIRVVAAN